jgi:hypothetical protein
MMWLRNKQLTETLGQCYTKKDMGFLFEGDICSGLNKHLNCDGTIDTT